MYAERHAVTLTTDENGDATGYTPVVTGRVLSIRYVKTDYAAGVDFDVTGETTGVVLWDQDDVNASATVYPRAQVHNTAGTALTYDGTRTVNEPVCLAGERVKIVVGSGGDTKTGVFHVVIG